MLLRFMLWILHPIWAVKLGINVTCRVGKHLNKYTAGKIPKAFKHICSMQLWEEVLSLTEPLKWSPNAMYQATRIFASNLGVKKAERFYRLVLLPCIRNDIRKNKRLHFALTQAVKKSIYKPAAFNKGILFPLCEVWNFDDAQDRLQVACYPLTFEGLSWVPAFM